MEVNNGKVNIKYYRRASGVIVRVIDDVALEYLNKEADWVPNQEWYISMFIDGEDEYQEISKAEVNACIDSILNNGEYPNINKKITK